MVESITRERRVGSTHLQMQQGETRVLYVIFQPRMQNLNLSLRKYETNPN